MNPIQQAAFELRLDDLEAQVRAGVDVDGALSLACASHDADAALQRRVIRFLLNNGSELQETDKNGVTPLHRAVRHRNPGAVEELIEQGADVNAVDRRSGSTPLHRAVTSSGAPATKGKRSEALEIARLLLAAGADPARVNKAGRTPVDSIRDDRMRSVFGEFEGG